MMKPLGPLVAIQNWVRFPVLQVHRDVYGFYVLKGRDFSGMERSVTLGRLYDMFDQNFVRAAIGEAFGVLPRSLPPEKWDEMLQNFLEASRIALAYTQGGVEVSREEAREYVLQYLRSHPPIHLGARASQVLQALEEGLPLYRVEEPRFLVHAPHYARWAEERGFPSGGEIFRLLGGELYRHNYLRRGEPASKEYWGLASEVMGQEIIAELRLNSPPWLGSAKGLTS